MDLPHTFSAQSCSPYYMARNSKAWQVPRFLAAKKLQQEASPPPPRRSAAPPASQRKVPWTPEPARRQICPSRYTRGEWHRRHRSVAGQEQVSLSPHVGSARPVRTPVQETGEFSSRRQKTSRTASHNFWSSPARPTRSYLPKWRRKALKPSPSSQNLGAAGWEGGETPHVTCDRGVTDYGAISHWWRERGRRNPLCTCPRLGGVAVEQGGGAEGALRARPSAAVDWGEVFVSPWRFRFSKCRVVMCIHDLSFFST